MISTDEASGFALLCDERGRLLRVVRDELGLGERETHGSSFTSLIDESSLDKSLRFLEHLRTRRAAFNWELNALIGGQIVPLHFAGAMTDADDCLIIGASSLSGIAGFFEELTKINNEQTNALRALLKDQTLQARAQSGRDEEMLEEFSRLNNELATLQRELAKKNVELERLNEQKNHLLGFAAHDLRSPLGVILNYGRFLRDGEDLSAAERNLFISRIISSSKFMLRLIDDLLDVSKIEAGKLDLDLQPRDLDALIRENLELNRVLAENKQIKLLFESEEALPPVLADGEKIDQVLNNLIGNALKFSAPGTTIRLRTYVEAESAVVSVADEGAGIPPDEIDKIFNPFQRTSVRSTGGEKSTGLGLAIVRKIVLGHRGSIRVESEEGKGTTFYVSLPLAPKAH